MLIIYNIQTNIFINRIMNSHILFYFQSMLFIGNVTLRTIFFCCLLPFPYCLKKMYFCHIIKIIPL